MSKQIKCITKMGDKSASLSLLQFDLAAITERTGDFLLKGYISASEETVCRIHSVDRVIICLHSFEKQQLYM